MTRDEIVAHPCQVLRYAHHEAVRLPLPPDWSGGYTSIFADQQHEAQAVGDAAAQPRTRVPAGS